MSDTSKKDKKQQAKQDKQQAKQQAKQDKQQAKQQAKQDKQQAKQQAKQDKQQAKQQAKQDKRSRKSKKLGEMTEDTVGTAGIDVTDDTDDIENIAQSHIELGEIEIDDGVPEGVQLNLFGVIDKEIPGLLQYFRGCGVNITKIDTDVTGAKNNLMTQPGYCRTIVIETGTGKFTATKIRQELIELMSLAADTEKKVSVYYTNNIIKTEAFKLSNNAGKYIRWKKYTSMVDVVADILTTNEEYSVFEIEDDVKIVDAVELLAFKGFETALPNESTNNTEYDIKGLIANMLESESLEKFEVNTSKK